MKRMQKLIVILLALWVILSVGVFVACEEVHEHSFDGDYDGDLNNHWRTCSCGAAGPKEAHVDADEDCKCDVCGKDVPHVHKFDSWTSDDLRHWKLCTWDNYKDEASREDHIDSDNNRTCDVCGHHMHAGTEIGKNENGHWKYCPDDGTMIGSVEAHKDENKDGKCDVCEMHVHNYTKTGSNDSQHWKLCPDDNEIDESSRANHILTTVIGDCEIPSEDNDGSATLTCAEEGCVYSKKISLKYLNTSEAVSVRANPDEEVYFYARKDGYSIYIPSVASMSIGETTSLEYVLSANFDDDYNFVVSYMGEEIEAGTVSLGDVRVVLFKASSTDGNISFKMDWGPGVTPETAIALNKNTDYTGEIVGDTTYFKYTATQDEEIVLFNSNGGDNIIADGDYAQYKYNIYSLSAGESLAICITSGDYSFKLINKEAGKSYEGWTPSTAIEVEGNTLQSSGEAIGTKYYKVTATQAGRISLSFSCEGGNVSHLVGDVSYGYFIENYAGAPYLGVGDVAYVEVSCSSEDVNISYSASISYTALSAVDNNFIVKDVEGNPVANVTVSLKDSDDNVVYSGITNAEGKVVLNYIPAVYKIELSGFDADVYSYNAVSTKWDADDPATDAGQDYELKLIKSVSKTVIVKGGDSVIAGVKVIITTNSSNGNVITSGVTDAEGKATISYLPPADGTRYRVKLEDLPQQYYLGSTVRFYASDLDDLTVELSDSKVYNVSIIVPDGMDVSVAGLKVVLEHAGIGSQFEGVVGSDGKAVVYVSIPADSKYLVTIQGLPSNIKGEGVLESGVYSTDITLEAIGGGSDTPQPSGNSLALGDNNVSVSYDEKSYWWGFVDYVFTSAEGGNFVLTFGTNHGFGAVYLPDSLYEPILAYSEYDEEGIFSYTFSLKAGKSITFKISSVGEYDEENFSSDSFTINIAESAAPAPVTILSFGDNLVAATYLGNALTFTSEEGGIYVISSNDENFFMQKPDGEWVDASNNYTFELEAGGSITFLFSIYDNSASDQYVVNIANGMAK